MKVSELEGVWLDYWVARALGYPLSSEWNQGDYILVGTGKGDLERFSPSSNWSDGGPIIEAYGLELRLSESKDPGWDSAPTAEMHKWQPGPSPLMAAMRAFVWRTYEEDVPDE